jgi:hypothetical protein
MINEDVEKLRKRMSEIEIRSRGRDELTVKREEGPSWVRAYMSSAVTKGDAVVTNNYDSTLGFLTVQRPTAANTGACLVCRETIAGAGFTTFYTSGVVPANVDVTGQTAGCTVGTQADNHQLKAGNTGLGHLMSTVADGDGLYHVFFSGEVAPAANIVRHKITHWNSPRSTASDSVFTGVITLSTSRLGQPGTIEAWGIYTPGFTTGVVADPNNLNYMLFSLGSPRGHHTAISATWSLWPDGAAPNPSRSVEIAVYFCTEQIDYTTLTWNNRPISAAASKYMSTGEWLLTCPQDTSQSTFKIQPDPQYGSALSALGRLTATITWYAVRLTLETGGSGGFDDWSFVLNAHPATGNMIIMD